MTHFQRVRFLLVPVAALAFAMPSARLRAQQPGFQTTKADCDDYGTGGRRETDADTTGAVLQGSVYDSKGTLRERETDQYSTEGGSKQKTERHILDFNERGKLTLEADYKFDMKGGLSSLDLTHYGYHGERSWEQTTDYRLDGFETREWKSLSRSWTSDFTPYKKPDAPKPGAEPQAQISSLPTNTNIGVLFPRDFQAGDSITGSLAPAGYAEGFKTIPGLYESSFPIQLYHLPDGSPNWSNLEVGVKGYGYFPVTPKGKFSLHIPVDYTGALKLQTRLLDPVTGAGPSSAFPEIGESVAAPAMPQNMLSAADQAEMQYWMTEDLIDLWNEAFDRENELDEYYETHAKPNMDDVDEMKDDLDEVYEDIDSLTARLPTEVVVKLARGLAKKHRDINAKLREKENLTSDEKAELKEYDDWASFLEDEADAANWIDLFGPKYSITPFWTSPVLTQNKLGALRGSFANDSFLNSFRIDNIPISPLASTPNVLYFMPPSGLTAGLHNYAIDSPGMPETTLPVFYMTLTMWADQLNLRKGQSTTYHVKLDGLNGLPASAWKSSFFSGDLIGQAEYLGGQPNAQLPGPSRAGTITLSVTNQSPGTISMMNSFHTLDAHFFAPSGSYQLDGGVGAIMDGTFSILGVARAYLQPEEGLGSNPAPPSSPSYAPASSDWLPTGGWHYNPDSSAGSGFTTHCPTSGAATADSGASSECMGSTATELYDQATGSQYSTTVGNPSPKEVLDAAKKRVDDAKEKKNKAEDDHQNAEWKVEQAWQKGALGAPGGAFNNDNMKAFHDASMARAQLARAEDLEKIAHSPAHKKAVEDAKDEYERLDKAERRSHDELPKKFTTEDRAAYDFAVWAAREAEKDLLKAKAGLREAEGDLKAAEKAMKDSAPSTPGTTPSSPGTPNTPSTPSVPSTPATPSTPSTPGTPGSPGTPGTPSTPNTPGSPGTPSAPSTPSAPGTTSPPEVRIPIG